jgi:cytochrome c oxidase subunit II
MLFALFAVAALAWLVSILPRIVLGRPSFRRAPMLAGTVIVLILAAISMVMDLRSLARMWRAPDSGISIVIIDTGEWLQLGYSRGETSFVTANELHVPAGAIVRIDWRGPNLVGWSVHDFLPITDGRSFFIAADAGLDEAWLIRLWPSPRHRRVPIVADSSAAFDRWFLNESKPAMPSALAPLFTSCGCAYCHVIRGVTEKPWKRAPDLTHFAVRRTIAATMMPNKLGFLAGWVVDSSGLKSGSEMPRNRLEPVVLHQLLHYLESLQ